MTALMRFQINEPATIHETLDDEVVVVDLEQGNYFSLRDVGAQIWRFIADKAAIEDILVFLTTSYEGKTDEIKTALEAFITELQQEKLITACPEDASSDAHPKPQPAIKDHKQTFTLPQLQKYTDMQDLLLLDPIHEVDETGWPNPNQPITATDKSQT